MTFVARARLQERIRTSLTTYPVVALIGARQVGKSTLARPFASSEEHFFDLERSLDALRLRENAMGILGSLKGTVVIDEAQEMPELFGTLRVLADREHCPARFVITGSVSPQLLSAGSESLAGRVAWVRIDGLSLAEVGPEHWRRLWLRGGLPRSFLARDDWQSIEIRENYLDSLIGRDLRFWGMADHDPAYIRRLLMLVSDASGQTWNHSEAGNTLRVSYKTIQKHVSILQGAFLVRELLPMVATTESRLRKKPKLIMRDSGVMHALLRLAEQGRLESHSRLGGSWETFCIQQVMAMTECRAEDAYLWNVQGGAEVDLVLDLPIGRVGFEMKHSDAPSTTRSMHTAIDELGLEKLFVLHPGNGILAMHSQAPIYGVGIEKLEEICIELRTRL